MIVVYYVIRDLEAVDRFQLGGGGGREVNAPYLKCKMDAKAVEAACKSTASSSMIGKFQKRRKDNLHIAIIIVISQLLRT